MMPRPSWLWFLFNYLRLCVLVVLLVLLVVGLPAAACIGAWWPR